MRSILGVVFALALLVPVSSRAGIADSPLPVLVVGQTTFLLYSVPGVMNDFSTTLATFFSCTSTSSSSETVGVELFGAPGGAPLNDATMTEQTVAPGATVTFGTTAVPYASASLGNPVMARGSARILSTSKSLICTAFIADSAHSTPTTMTSLTIVAKTKQKALN